MRLPSACGRGSEDEPAALVDGHFDAAPWREATWRRQRPASRVYIEVKEPSTSDALAARTEQVARVTDILETRSLITQHTPITLEGGPELISAVLGRSHSASLDRVVLRLETSVHPGAVVSELSDRGIRCSGSWRAPQTNPESLQWLDRLMALLSRENESHIALEFPGDRGARLVRSQLQRIASRLQHAGHRRLSRVTFGRPSRVSPTMHHVRSGGEYLGIGPAAASMRLVGDGVVRFRQGRAQTGGPAGERAIDATEERLSVPDHLRELVMLQLPTDAGCRIDELQARLTGLDDALRVLRRRLSDMAEQGLVQMVRRGVIRPTPAGWSRIDEMITGLWSSIEGRTDE